MSFRLGVASLGVASLAYIFSPLGVILWLMVPVGGLIWADSCKVDSGSQTG